MQPLYKIMRDPSKTLRDVTEIDVSYIVFTDGSRYYAKNGSTGMIEYSDTDATKVIQYAINEANKVGGGRILVKRGRYNLSWRLELINVNNIVLEGEGFGTELVATTKTMVVYTRDANNIVIRNMKLVGNTTDYALATVAINGGMNIVVEGCEITNGGHNGLIIGHRIVGVDPPPSTTTTNVLIRGNYIHDNYDDAIDIAISAENIVIEGNYIVSNQYIGISLTPTTNQVVRRVVIRGNVIKKSWQTDGIVLQGYIEGAVVEGNIIEEVRIGIWVGEVPGTYRDIVVKGNIVRSTTHYGIHVSSPANNVVIEGNKLYNIGTRGIYTNNVANCIIANNHIEEVVMEGILVEKSSSCLVLGNTLINTEKENISGRPHIRLHENTQYCTVAMNIIKNNVPYPPAIGETYSTTPPNYNIIVDNDVRLSGNKTIVVQGANTVVRRNRGYVTENFGVATISTGSTRVTVSHGLARTPSKALITPLAQPPGKLWVENITSTSFDIVTDTAPTSDLNVAWYAEV
jgi:parallel beta-helix repeat protein